MANTKHSMARTIIIDRLLRKSQGSTVQQMLDAVNESLEVNGFPPVSINTIRNDIDTIRYVFRRKIREERHGYNKYYSYSHLGDSIFKNVLTFDEIEHLHSAMMSILFCDPLQGTLLYERLSHRLSDMLDVNPSSDPIVLYKKVPSKFSCKIFKALYRHIRSKTPALITCQSKDKTAEEVRIVHPYFILFDCPNYYLLCYDATNKRPNKIPIRNCKHVTTAYDVKFIPNKYYPLEEFYENHVTYV